MTRKGRADDGRPLRLKRALCRLSGHHVPADDIGQVDRNGLVPDRPHRARHLAGQALEADERPADTGPPVRSGGLGRAAPFKVEAQPVTAVAKRPGLDMPL